MPHLQSVSSDKLESSLIVGAGVFVLLVAGADTDGQISWVATVMVLSSKYEPTALVTDKKYNGKHLTLIR